MHGFQITDYLETDRTIHYMYMCDTTVVRAYTHTRTRAITHSVNSSSRTTHVARHMTLDRETEGELPVAANCRDERQTAAVVFTTGAFPYNP